MSILKFTCVFIADEKCQCNQTKAEAELREKKLKLILREEEALYKMKKEEQQMKNEIASVQLRILKEKKTYLAKKRKLQLEILSKQLNSFSKMNADEGNGFRLSLEGETDLVIPRIETNVEKAGHILK